MLTIVTKHSGLADTNVWAESVMASVVLLSITPTAILCNKLRNYQAQLLGNSIFIAYGNSYTSKVRIQPVWMLVK